MTSLQQLRTPRLLLSRISMSDLDDLVPFYADARVTATLGGTRSAEWVSEYLQKQIAHWDEHGFGFWTARDPDTGRFAGRGGLRHAIIEGHTVVEVGYGFAEEFWGRGLATELAREAVRVGFAELELAELACFTLPTNHASRRVMEKVGFRYECDVLYAELPHLLFRQSRGAWVAV
jgi:[ribosomal protein S5]-alanine N-acetyltransferase